MSRNNMHLLTNNQIDWYCARWIKTAGRVIQQRNIVSPNDEQQEEKH